MQVIAHLPVGGGLLYCVERVVFNTGHVLRCIVTAVLCTQVFAQIETFNV